MMDSEVKVGDEIKLYDIRHRGNHGAYIIVTKVNKKTFKGIEKKGSYVPGMEWTVCKDVNFSWVKYNEKGLMYFVYKEEDYV